MSVEPLLSAAESPVNSRYRRVIEILDRASVASSSSSQGYGPYWRLPYEGLLEFSLYGVRMIVPGIGRSTAATPTPPTPPSSARGSPPRG